MCLLARVIINAIKSDEELNFKCMEITLCSYLYVEVYVIGVECGCHFGA